MTLKQRLGSWLIPRLPVNPWVFRTFRVELNAMLVRLLHRLHPGWIARRRSSASMARRLVGVAIDSRPDRNAPVIDLSNSYIGSLHVLDWQRVAGLIAADTDNGIGIAGAGFNLRILPVRVLGKCGGYDSDIIDGIRTRLPEIRLAAPPGVSVEPIFDQSIFVRAAVSAVQHEILLVGGLVALVGRAALHTGRFGVGGLLDRLVGLFGRGNVCVELQRHLLRDEEEDNMALAELAKAFRVPVVAANGVSHATPEDRALMDVLTCVRHHTTIDEAGRLLARKQGLRKLLASL